jgi:hypothetical protein
MLASTRAATSARHARERLCGTPSRDAIETEHAFHGSNKPRRLLAEGVAPLNHAVSRALKQRSHADCRCEVGPQRCSKLREIPLFLALPERPYTRCLRCLELMRRAHGFERLPNEVL